MANEENNGNLPPDWWQDLECPWPVGYTEDNMDELAKEYEVSDGR